MEWLSGPSMTTVLVAGIVIGALIAGAGIGWWMYKAMGSGVEG